MKTEEGIIHFLARQYSKTIQDPMWSFDDLLAEGLLTWATLLTQQEFVNSNGEQKDLLFISIKNRFIDIHRYERVMKRSAIKVPLWVLEREQEIKNMGFKFVELEPNEKEVVRILLEGPQELVDLGKGNGATKRSVIKYLVDYRGWTHQEADHFWKGK